MFYRQEHPDEEYISWVRRQKPAARARIAFLAYTFICSLPTVIICLLLLLTSHFHRYEIIGIISFITAATMLFVFDSLRIAAHKCYDDACAKGLARYDFEKHFPVVSTEYVYWRLARLAYAI
jgi:hypothetical protein